MRQFIKFFFASLLGTVAGFFVFMFIGFILILSISAVLVSGFSGEGEVKVKPNSVLKMELAYDIPERTSDNPFQDFDLMSLEANVALGLNDILENIEKAKTDDNIKGIYLDLSITPNGFATIEAIRNQLIDFKESGKFIVAYAEVMGQRSYYLASVADAIYVNPVGFMDFRGFQAQLAFFKNTLEKLEIEPQIFYAGKYKSATEPFRLEKMSDANREQLTEYVDEVYGLFLKNIAESRGIDMALLDSISVNMLVRQPQDAVTYGLADGTMYFDEVVSVLKEKVSLKDDDDLELVSLEKYQHAPASEKEDYSEDKIAVVYAEGDIVDGDGEADNIGSARFAKAIRQVRKDDKVKAMVLRINSGGGSALASDVILREVELVAEKMPVIVSMGDVAASGGYYIACKANEIIAQPNTVTGSIGVFGILPNMQGLFNNKLGITFDEVSTGKFSGINTVSRPLSAEERHIIQAQIDTIYLTFKQRVAEGRQLSIEYVDSIAQGRIWTGVQAKKIGLVDELGGLDMAIAHAAEKAGITDYMLKEYPKSEDPIEKLMKELSGNVETYFLKRELGENYAIWKKLEEVKNMRGAQARMPFTMEIN